MGFLFGLMCPGQQEKQHERKESQVWKSGILPTAFCSRRLLQVFATGLVLSLVLSLVFSLGYAPIVGTVSGALVGLVNFTASYQYGVWALHRVDQDLGESREGEDSRFSTCAGTLTLGSQGFRFLVIALALAVMARYFGMSALLLCTGMLFAIQIPLFIGLVGGAGGPGTDLFGGNRHAGGSSGAGHIRCVIPQGSSDQ